MKTLAKFLLAVTLIIQSQFVQNGSIYCDFVLQDQQYKGVAYDDMFDMLNTALELEANQKLTKGVVQ